MDPEKSIRQKWRLLKATMDERARRLWAGAEAEALGWGGIVAVARATNLAISTVTLGRNEVRAGARADDVVKVRRKGGGRPRHEVTYPELVPSLEKLVDPVTRGDPESPLRWTSKSTHSDCFMPVPRGILGCSGNRLRCCWEAPVQITAIR
jgi:hypothetical protein